MQYPLKRFSRNVPIPGEFFFGASDRNRTSDTRIFSPLLYQLSYRGIGEVQNEPHSLRADMLPQKRPSTFWGKGGVATGMSFRALRGSKRSAACSDVATRMGLEPTTSGVTGRRSNQLNYRARWWEQQGSNL